MPETATRLSLYSYLPILVTLVLVLSVVNANSQEPTPPRSHTHQSKQSAAATGSNDYPPAQGKFILATEPPSDLHPTERPYVENNYYNQSGSGWDTIWFFVQAIGTIALVFIAIYSGKMLRQQMLLTHRPLIRARVVNLTKELIVNEPIEICLELANIGATSAKIISSNVTVKISDSKVVPWRLYSRFAQPYTGEVDTIEKWIKEHHKDDPSPTLASGLTLNMVKTRDMPTELQPHERDSLADGSLAIWVLGFVYYQDEAGQHRKTAFCYRAKHPDLRFYKVDDPDLSYDDN
jgi:hypothetical protein